MPSSRTRKKSKARTRFTAATADRHALYQFAVQDVEAEIDFVDETYHAIRGRRALRLREDFCGTANTSCEWIRRRRNNVAVGLDLDEATLEWGREHNVASLTPAQHNRITLLRRDVLDPGPQARGMDAVLAMNFSYWIFRHRATMRSYFENVRRSLAPGGVFFLDCYGGYESQDLMEEPREIIVPRKKGGGRFTYVWHQAEYNPINGDMTCHIHFRFPDGTRMRHAFTYHWRLWTLPEIREILHEAGFSRSTVYWEGTDEDGEGDGVFKPSEVGEVCASWIAYVVAEK